MTIQLQSMLNTVARSLLAGSLLFIQTPAQSQPKAWEQDDVIVRRAGDAGMGMSRDGASNAPRGNFYARAENSKSGIRADFRGKCSELAVVSVLALDTRKINLEPFFASQSGSDLPIHDVLQLMRQGLAEQCEQLQVVRMTFRPASLAQGTFSYQGTLTKSGGWRLQDGRISTPYDDAHVFEIRTRDAFSVAGLNYRGPCEKEPTLLLEPMYRNESERAMHSKELGLTKALSLKNYFDLALAASPQYAKECPGVSRIRFAINPMPEAVLCKTAGDCFLEASLGKEWVVDASQFMEKAYNRPIKGTKDMLEVLAAGRFDIVEDYRPFFSYFVMNYFIIYYDHCKNHIREPVTRQTKIVERTRDSSGSITREDERVTIDIAVEKEHADVFDAHYGPGFQWAVWHLSRISTDVTPTGSAMDAAVIAVGSLFDEGKQMKSVLVGKCTDDLLLTIRQNMINFARSVPPVTGKYTTDKQPKTKYPPNGPSAPAFTATYLERKARVQREEKQDWSPPNPRNADTAGTPAAASQQGGAAASTSTISGTVQPRAPVDASTPAAPGKDSADDAKRRAVAMQELHRTHAQESSEALKEFQAKMKSATPQARRALQLEFRQRQQERQQDFQRKLKELSGR